MLAPAGPGGAARLASHAVVSGATAGRGNPGNQSVSRDWDHDYDAQRFLVSMTSSTLSQVSSSARPQEPAMTDTVVADALANVKLSRRHELVEGIKTSLVPARPLPVRRALAPSRTENHSSARQLPEVLTHAVRVYLVFGWTVMPIAASFPGWSVRPRASAGHRPCQ
jgi:hypothetical protein